MPKQKLEHTERLPIFVVVRELQRADDRVLIGNLFEVAAVYAAHVPEQGDCSGVAMCGGSQPQSAANAG